MPVRRKAILALALAVASGVSVSACATPQQQLGAAAVVGTRSGTVPAGLPQPASFVGAPPYFAPPQPYFGIRPEPGPCAQWVFDYSGDRVCASY